MRQQALIKVSSLAQYSRRSLQLQSTRPYSATGKFLDPAATNPNYSKALRVIAYGSVASGLLYATYNLTQKEETLDRVYKVGESPVKVSDGPDLRCRFEEGGHQDIDFHRRVRHKTPRTCNLLSETEIFKIADLINKLVNLDYFSEDEEQMIFEYYVKRVVYEVWEELPPVYMSLVHSSETQGLSTEEGIALEQRVMDFVHRKKEITSTLPCLDDVNEVRVKRCVVAIIVQSMINGNTLEKLTDPKEKTGQSLMLHVFIQGFISRFSDAEEKAKLIEMILNEVDVGIPGVKWVFKASLTYATDILGKCIEKGLNRSAAEFVHGKRYSDPMHASGLGIKDTPEMEAHYAQVTELLGMKAANSIEAKDGSTYRQFTNVLKRELTVLLVREMDERLASIPDFYGVKSKVGLAMVEHVIGKDESQKQRLEQLDEIMLVLKELTLSVKAE